MEWNAIHRRVTDGGHITRAEALAVLESSDDALLSVLDTAFAVRLRHFGRGVRLHVLRNARSGGCSEDCGYCSQSACVRPAATKRSPWQSCEEILDGAREASRRGATRYGVVSSGLGPTDAEVAVMGEIVRAIKAEVPLQVCLSLGVLSPVQAGHLKACGVDRYHHNLETTERHFARLCSTHSYNDRVATARAVQSAGLALCCGGILGAGETAEDRVELAFALRDLGADTIPVNFLDPRPGTPLERHPRMRPADCLRTLAMFRFVHPTTDLCVAGGRESCLGPMQVLALYPANSMFTDGYLTTPGQGYAADMAMLVGAGFQIDRVTQPQRSTHDGTTPGANP
jgi:biotin synthase